MNNIIILMKIKDYLLLGGVTLICLCLYLHWKYAFEIPFTLRTQEKKIRIGRYLFWLMIFIMLCYISAIIMDFMI